MKVISNQVFFLPLIHDSKYICHAITLLLLTQPFNLLNDFIKCNNCQQRKKNWSIIRIKQNIFPCPYDILFCKMMNYCGQIMNLLVMIVLEIYCFRGIYICFNSVLFQVGGKSGFMVSLFTLNLKFSLHPHLCVCYVQ